MKRFRFLILAALFAGVFLYLTSVARSRYFSGGGEAANARSILWSEPAVRGAGLSSDELNNIDVYKVAHSATVNITSIIYRRNWFFDVVPDKGTGSGFIIDAEKGLILTNAHVLAGSQKITVTLTDQSRHDATVLVRDTLSDLGLVQITPRKKLSALHLGDSDSVQVGQKVLAIGNPFGLEGTLTTGIISSIGRTIQDETNRKLEGMMQTDAAINPGNSGGPLLDSQGNVIGINTAIYGPGGNIGIGFAMPINKAKVMLTDFRAGKSFKRPRLGVEVLFVMGEWAEALQLPSSGGLLVQGVQRGSAADRAGVRGPRQFAVVGNQEIGIGGDLITAIDGKPTDRNDAISAAMMRKRAGDKMELTVLRGGKTVKMDVTLGAAPDEEL